SADPSWGCEAAVPSTPLAIRLGGSAAGVPTGPPELSAAWSRRWRSRRSSAAGTEPSYSDAFGTSATASPDPRLAGRRSRRFSAAAGALDRPVSSPVPRGRRSQLGSQLMAGPPCQLGGG